MQYIFEDEVRQCLQDTGTSPKEEVPTHRHQPPATSSSRQSIIEIKEKEQKEKKNCSKMICRDGKDRGESYSPDILVTSVTKGTRKAQKRTKV